MCVDYTDLNKACPRDAYPLPNIDRLVDGAAGNKVLCFLDAYSGYNQIPMAVSDMNKTAFITDDANYFYRVMPFGLKNAGATYQRLMDKVFSHLMGQCDVTPTSPSSSASRSPSPHQGLITRSMMRKIHMGLSQVDQVNHGLFTLFTWAKEISKI